MVEHAAGEPAASGRSDGPAEVRQAARWIRPARRAAFQAPDRTA